MLDANTQAIIDSVSDYVAQHFPAATPMADVGCGEGWLLKKLADSGFAHLTGIGFRTPDLSAIPTISAIDLCAENWSQKCGEARYQVIVSTEVIEHLTNPFLFLSQTRRLLVEGGTLILTFPNVHTIRSIIGYALTGRLSGFFGPNFNDGHPLHDQHIFIPNIHLIRYLVKVAGYSVSAEHYINGRGRLFAQTTMMVAKRTAAHD